MSDLSLLIRFVMDRERERRAIKRIETSIHDGEERIMGTLADLSTRLQSLDAKSSEVASWVANELSTLRGQIQALQDALDQSAIDAAEVDVLSSMVDEIAETVDRIDDPEVGPQPEPEPTPEPTPEPQPEPIPEPEPVINVGDEGAVGEEPVQP